MGVEGVGRERTQWLPVISGFISGYSLGTECDRTVKEPVLIKENMILRLFYQTSPLKLLLN